FDADRNNQRFTERDLINLVRVTQDLSINSLKDFHQYQQKFFRVGGWLQGKGKLTESQMNKYFWKGIPKKLQQEMEARILAASPNYDISTPFPILEIVTAAEKIFQRTRFDLDDSDNEMDPDWPESDSDTENSSDELDSDESTRSKSKQKSRKQGTFRAP